MNAWTLVATVLAGITLIRVWRHGLWVAAAGLIALAVASGARCVEVAGPLGFATALLSAGVAILVWARAPRTGGWQLLALFTFLASAVLQIAMLGGPAPHSAGGWPWLIAFLLLADPTTRLLRWGLEAMGKVSAGGAGGTGRGEAIGIVERWILLVVLARGQYAAMAFLMAAKALARHKRFEDDPEFAEYFLLGTLASVLAAIVVAETLTLLGVALPPRMP